MTFKELLLSGAIGDILYVACVYCLAGLRRSLHLDAREGKGRGSWSARHDGAVTWPPRVRTRLFVQPLDRIMLACAMLAVPLCLAATLNTAAETHAAEGNFVKAHAFCLPGAFTPAAWAWHKGFSERRRGGGEIPDVSAGRREVSVCAVLRPFLDSRPAIRRKP